MHRESAIGLIDAALRRREDVRPCLVDADGSLSSAEVLQQSMHLASGLSGRGITAGTRVAILSPNCNQAFLLVLAILRVRAVWLPVPARNPVEQNARFLKNNRCEFLFFHDSLREAALALAASTPSLRASACLSADDWHRTSGPVPDPADADPEDLVWIKSTGGTTGEPKSAMLCNRNAAALFRTFDLCMPSRVPPVNLCVAPMTHGAGNIALASLAQGGSVISRAKPEALAILNDIEHYKVTSMFLPPTVIYRLLNEPSVRSRDYGSLQYFIYSGAPMSDAKLAEAIEIFGPVMTQCWGQTEAPLICTFMGPKEHVDDQGRPRYELLRSCGRPSPLTEVAVMTDSGELLGKNATAELVVRGDLVMKGYMDMPRENEEVSRHGWHHTGDVGYIDDAGYVYIVDRKKDMIISGGFNIFPAEIEQALWSHPAVSDCAVVGVPDDHWGESVKAIVELKDGAQVSADELSAHCRQIVGGMKTPKSFEFWPSLPRSQVGKVLKREIRDRYWQGRQRQV